MKKISLSLFFVALIAMKNCNCTIQSNRNENSSEMIDNQQPLNREQLNQKYGSENVQNQIEIYEKKRTGGMLKVLTPMQHEVYNFYKKNKYTKNN